MFSHFPTTTHPVHIKAGGCTAREWVDWGHVHEGWSRFGSCFGKVRVHFWWFLWARLRPHLQLYKYTVTQVFAWVTRVIVWNCNCVSVIHLSSTAVGTVTFRLTFTEAFVSNICREKQRSAIRVKLWFRVILRGVLRKGLLNYSKPLSLLACTTSAPPAPRSAITCSLLPFLFSVFV